MLSELVGSSGKVIGVDLSAEMLDRAREKTRHFPFNNVTLVQENMVHYQPPDQIDAVLSTYALEMVPEYDHIIAGMTHVLRDSGRFAALGLKHPESWPEWLVEFGILLARPFKVSRAYESIRPFDSIRAHLECVQYEEFLAGSAYLCVGSKA
jgi:demethylmenaquinone methyltransferase/2-methoxy-6-polyprenyl-1,4-benzoquinol methylase